LLSDPVLDFAFLEAPHLTSNNAAARCWDENPVVGTTPNTGVAPLQQDADKNPSTNKTVNAAL